MVRKAIIKRKTPEAKTNHKEISIRYEKRLSQLLIAIQAKGAARAMLIASNKVNSLERSKRIFLAEAPNTLRIPNSFVLLSVVNVTNPKSPRQAMLIATPVKTPKILASRSSPL